MRVILHHDVPGYAVRRKAVRLLHGNFACVRRDALKLVVLLLNKLPGLLHPTRFELLHLHGQVVILSLLKLLGTLD